MSLDFSKTKILVVGDIMLDQYLISDVKRISSEAPVPIALIKKRWSVPGGAANVARNLVKLGVQTKLVGICGQDPNASILKTKLDEEKIQSDLLYSIESHTITKTRVLAHGQQLLRIDEEHIRKLNSDEKQNILSKASKALKDVHALILSDYAKGIFLDDLNKQDNSQSLSQALIMQAKAQNIPVCIDPKGLDWKKYQGASCVTPNENEFQIIANIEDSNDDENFFLAAENICQKYNLSRLLVTRGAKGMTLFEPKQALQHFSSVAREIADVSGAGDTSIATLTACVANNYSWAESIKIANIAAGIVVGKLGTASIEIDELNAKI